MSGIVNSASFRRQADRSWASKALVYSLASGLAGVVAGALLGLAGRQLPPVARLAGTSLLAVAAVVAGGLELLGWRLSPLQRDRETPQRWLDAGAWRWAARNGAALGIGATSRIGFWLWYAVPCSALLAGHPGLGAAIYGLYGLVRGAAVWVLILGLVRRRGDDIGPLLLRRKGAARALAAGQLVLVGMAIICAVGI